MDLRYHSERAMRTQQTRQMVRRAGVTFAGQSIWTDEEGEVLREMAPDYAAIAKALPHRTLLSIKKQCQKRGLKRKVHFWTASEISKLRRMYPHASQSEICEVFPHSTWTNIQQAARYHGFRRARKPYKPTGNLPLDELLEKCVEYNLWLPDIDKECRTKSYFQRQRWRRQRVNYNCLVKAIELLDGKFEVRWTEE